MMILHAKQKCTRFSILSSDFHGPVKEGQRGTQVSQTLTERGICLAVTTVDVFAEPNISREHAFLVVKEKQNNHKPELLWFKLFGSNK